MTKRVVAYTGAGREHLITAVAHYLTVHPPVFVANEVPPISPVSWENAELDTLVDGYPQSKHSCGGRIPFAPAPDHFHTCRKFRGHDGRHRCGCFGGKCRVSWKDKKGAS